MEKNKISKVVKEVLKEKSKSQHSPERQPSITPETPDREVHPGTKPTVVPKRRTLTPPKEAPKTNPKGLSEGDKEMINKIVSKYTKLKGESVREQDGEFGTVEISITGNGRIKDNAIIRIKSALRTLTGKAILKVDGKEINPRY